MRCGGPAGSPTLREMGTARGMAPRCTRPCGVQLGNGPGRQITLITRATAGTHGGVVHGGARPFIGSVSSGASTAHDGRDLARADIVVDSAVSGTPTRFGLLGTDPRRGWEPNGSAPLAPALGRELGRHDDSRAGRMTSPPTHVPHRLDRLGVDRAASSDVLACGGRDHVEGLCNKDAAIVHGCRTDRAVLPGSMCSHCARFGA